MKTSNISLYFFSILFFISFNIQSQDKNSLSISKEDGLLSIKQGGKTLLGYQYGIMYPPKGIDSAYQRSGFIHPLNTLKGHRLTRIQPEDHYHHYGLWNPWTHTLFEGDTLDFWNIRGKQGTIRFAEFKSTTTNDDYVEYQALHEHVVLKNGENKVALNELQTVRLHQPNDDYYIVDLEFDYSCATESEFKILAYRYQGLGWRGTEEWNDDNSKITTSEGKDRSNADNTTARWMLYQGELGNDYGGMIMLSSIQNYSYPEPIRVWPIGNHEGSTFANFNPTKHQDWLFEPGKTYTLKYRLVVFNDELTTDKAEEFWQDYNK